VRLPSHDRPALFTIGHSNHEWPVFVALLRQHAIDAVADVRSSPYSPRNPQFNRETLEKALREASVKYVFLGRELGARREERSCYIGGQARYDLVKDLPLFRQGLERVRRGTESMRIALMCAEKDPITCHRMVLVTRALADFGLSIEHIREDGRIESTAEAEARLHEASGVPREDLFRPKEELLAEAYRVQGLRLAWTEESPNVPVQ